jgi:hypothetical protein
MPDGETHALRISDPLGLTIAAMHRTYIRLCGESLPEGNFGGALDLLERSIDIDPGAPPLLVIAHGVLQEDIPDV